MSQFNSAPYFPAAPPYYNQMFMDQLVRAFFVFVQQANNPGESRNTFAVFTNLQQNDYALEVGAIYRQGNVLYIVVLDIAAPVGISSTASVGNVTVVIS